MSFGTKYKHIFKDYNNDSWEFHLQKDGYASTEYTLDGGASPIMILDPNQGNGIFTPIRGTKLNADLFIDTNGSYDFLDDFWGITDREWQALLYKTTPSTYLAECEITNLNISAVSTDATGQITIDGLGGIATTPRCLCSFDILNFPPATPLPLNIYATPKDEDNQSPNRKFLGTVDVAFGEDTEDVIDKIAALGADWSKDSANSFVYTQSTFDADIDSTWNVKIEYRELLSNPYTFYTQYTGFSGATEPQWIEIDLVSKNTLSTNPNVINLARYEYTPGEGVGSVATALAASMDGTEVNNVYYPTSAEFINLVIGSTTSGGLGANIDIELQGIGSKGNYFDILDTLVNDTYIRIHKRTDSTYSWTDVDFSGGADTGDEFKIEVDKGAGNVTIGSTLAYTGDTDSEIIQRLILSINNSSEIFSAIVDPLNDAKLKITVDDASTWTYKFSTSGASTVTPSTDTSFTTATKQVVYWRGWVIPGLYTQEHQSGIIQVELSALDGLGDLKNFTFEVNDNRPFEKLSLIKIISYALEKTGFNLRIYEAFDLFHLYADSSLSPLVQTYQDASRLNGINCYNVLAEIVTGLKATLTQRNDRWEIIPIDQQDASYTNRVFDFTGNYIESVVRSGFIKDTGGKLRDNIFLNRSAVIEFEAGYRKVSVLQDYGFVNQLLTFPAFSSINDNISNIQYPWNWKLGDAIQSSFLGDISKTSEGYLRITDNSEHVGSIFYLEQVTSISDIQLENTESTQYEFKIVYKQDSNATTGFIFRAFITNKAGTATRWLKDTYDDPLSPVTENITIDMTESDKLKTKTIRFDYPTESQFNDEPSTFTVQLFQPTAEYVNIKSVELIVNTITVSGKRITSHYSELVNDLSNIILDKTVKLGDIPNTPNAQTIFKNALYWFDDEVYRLTSSWVLDPNTPVNQKPLVDHLREFYLSSLPTSVILMTSDVLGDLELRDILKDKSNLDKLFMLTGGELDIKKRMLSGEWQEIDIDVSGYTLVEITESFEDDSSGSNSYTTISGDTGTGEQTDLSNYYTKDEVESKLDGVTGTFLGSNLTAKQITINHNLAIDTPILYLYDNNNNLINQSNYEIDTAGDLNTLILTIHIPLVGGNIYKFRIL